MKNRILYLDFLRCFAIILVIGLHVITPYIARTELYGSRFWLLCVLCNELLRAGVPLFFMISGFLMLQDPRTSDAAAFYRKRLVRLLPPLVVWNLIYYLYNAGTEATPAGFLAALLNKGSSYHMWFVYTLLGIYLLAPFLKRLVDTCGRRQLWGLLAVVTFTGTLRPLLNSVLPVYIYLFEPLVENYVGYFLLGWLLGSAKLEKKAVWAASLCGAGGYLLGVWQNLSTASAESIPMPANIGYSANHYLLAAAVFVLCRKLFERFQTEAERISGALGALSGAVFGVYWVHVLALELIRSWLSLDLPPAALTSLELILTAAVSFAVALVWERVPVLRRLLM